MVGRKPNLHWYIPWRNKKLHSPKRARRYHHREKEA
jgi:hypothetical protein